MHKARESEELTGPQPPIPNPQFPIPNPHSPTTVTTYHTIICGAGIAGISAAYHLAVRRGVRNVLLVDERPPLTLTSDKSTECYRNWWPDPAMVALINRSIDIMEELAAESGNVFRMNRRGYLYLTADPERLPAFEQEARTPPRLGAGDLRIYRTPAETAAYRPAPPEGYRGLPDGADLLLGSAAVRRIFPYLSENVQAALHVRRAGWFSAQQLGMYLLEQARARGVELRRARITGVEPQGADRLTLHLSGNDAPVSLTTRNFVDAAGPFLAPVAGMLGVELPVHTEVHLKVAFRDPLGAVPREAPLLIWSDPQFLPWGADERGFLAEDPAARFLLDEMPPGAHTRPEGVLEGDAILLLWEYATRVLDPPVIPPPLDEMYPEIALRGMSAMLPRFREYFQRMPRPALDGGYYTKTRENRPLIGPLPVKGAYVIGALSGFGLMSSCAAGELLAAHITGGDLPSYAAAFHPARYDNPAYRQEIELLGTGGQL